MTTGTVGLPVSDLGRTVEWYRRAFELPAAELEPAYGIVEFRPGPVWLQLGVADVAAEREHLLSLGVDVGELDHVEGMVDYVDFADPDGNALRLYTEL